MTIKKLSVYTCVVALVVTVCGALLATVSPAWASTIAGCYQNGGFLRIVSSEGCRPGEIALQLASPDAIPTDIPKVAHGYWSSGKLVSGKGLSVSPQTTGNYAISFTTAFDEVPTCVVSSVNFFGPCRVDQTSKTGAFVQCGQYSVEAGEGPFVGFANNPFQLVCVQ
jgi:hypothetical protein